ncbi:MAG TPA: ABC transporter permease [Candidatus Blautia merdigallinarum]|uniref:ABC transporter permease n=1 Tax=Candidatus Blautia merdigallinarum TaxID=2838495 RepID=A0A9D2N4M4_9FIRM|nr:ABC transporter permease [Candidatus Blautia merdigallinarum]
MEEKKITVRKQKIKKNYTKIKLAVYGALTLLLILVAVFAPYITPYDPYEQDLGNALLAPCREYLLGTDRYGRDMLSRVIMGARSSISSAVLLVVIITVAGSIVGILCGYCQGKLDSFLMRLSDIFLAFPGMVFAIAAASVMSGGIMNAVAALAFVSWPKYARIARSQVLTIKNAPYISAARLAGSGTGKIILKHIVPNIAGPVIVTAVLDIGTMMMEIAGLSFLGLGATPPTAEWGSMMSNGRSMLQTSPWVILAPGCAIFLTVMVFNLLGDTVRDILDPRQSRRNRS